MSQSATRTVSEPRKVVIVNGFFPHYRKSIIKELTVRGRHHYLFAGDMTGPKGSGIEPYQEMSCDRFIHLPCLRLRDRAYFQRGLLRIVLRRDIAAVILEGDAKYLSTWLAAMLARVAGKRVLFWTHGWTHPDGWLVNLVRCGFYRLANGLLLYGPRARNIAVQKGFKSEATWVVYNSLDYDEQQAAQACISTSTRARLRRDYFRNPNLPVLFYVGRLTTSLQLHLLLDAMVLLRRRGCYLNLLVVGNGSERSALERVAAERLLPVHFADACYDERMLSQYFAVADVMVSPGKVGLSAVHSLAYGVPVITHGDPARQMPEYEAVTAGVNGAFFRYGSYEDLADQIQDWLSSGKRGDELTKACREPIERYYNPSYQRQVIDAAVSSTAV